MHTSRFQTHVVPERQKPLMEKLLGIAVRILLLFFALNVWAAGNPSKLAIPTTEARIDLSDHLDFLRDPERKLTFSDVLENEKQFRQATRRDLVTSFNPAAFWLRISLINNSNFPLIRWVATGNAKTQRVTLHIKHDSAWQILKSGRNVALLEKPIAALSPVFPVTLFPGEEIELLIHIDSRGATDMATYLWEPQAFLKAEGNTLVSQAILIGGLLLSSLLALIVFARLKETQYLWLGLLLMGIGGLEATRENLLGTYFWPEHIQLPPQTLLLFGCLAIFGISKVVSHALELDKKISIAYKLLLALRWIAVIGMVIAFWSYGLGVRIMSAATVVQNIATLFLSFLAVSQGQRVGKIFLVAFSLALLTETARQLANLGIIPWIAAMEFSTHFFLLAAPLILFGLVEQTRQLTAKLELSEQFQQAKSAFFARISHELRSPLNTILGYSRMLGRGSARLTLSEGTKSIETNTLRLLHLIDEILDDAQAATGRLSIKPTTMLFRPWLDEIVRTSRLIIEEKDNQFETDFAGPLNITLIADGGRLRQVISNLISNANRHTQQGRVCLTCHTTIGDREVTLDFAISDTGEGIDGKRLGKIFEPFERGPTTSPGHGLGLPICQELVRQMGGEIAVKSSLGTGSQFAFSIRCPLSENKVQSKDKGEPDSSTVDTLRVLIVDDDPVQLGLLSEQLENMHLVVYAEINAETAAKALEREAFDLVITDQIMPGIDGWGILERARRFAPSLPVVLISSTSPWPPDEFPQEIKFDATLNKPLSPDDIQGVTWCQILKRKSPEFLKQVDWRELAFLADEGDISGIEDWLRQACQKEPVNRQILAYIETLSHELNLAMIKKLAETIGSYSYA